MNQFQSRIQIFVLICIAAAECGMAKSPPAEAQAPTVPPVVLPSSDSQLPAYKVMLTSFDPFGGSSANNSQPIVAQLKSLAATIGPNITIETCNLPVVYDIGAQTAMDCFNKIKPDAVVSFGEAECSIRIETAATNLDNTPGAPDNAGNERTGTPILANGPERSGFNFPVEAMFCALPASGSNVDVSRSPGNFICNNVAYHMSQSLEAMNVPFTFIHVPNSECSSVEKNPITNAATIANMLAAAFSNLRNSAVSGSLWPHPPISSVLFPTDENGAQSLLKSLQADNAPACQLGFMNQLIAAYQDPSQD